MIFVTVGTHEQPFDRLVRCVDILKRDGVITEEVVMQTGYSTYEPRYCTWQPLFPYRQMEEKVEAARIVITHGGPSSFLMPLRMGKIPIVVPRQFRFGEHVNDHQVSFCREMAKRMGTILVVEDTQRLRDVILSYDATVSGMRKGQESNNQKFCGEFEKIVEQIMKNTE